MARRRPVDPYPQLASLERTFHREAVHLSGARRFYASEGVVVFAAGKDGIAAAAGAVWLRPSAYRRMNHYLDLKQSPSVGGFQATRPRRAASNRHSRPTCSRSSRRRPPPPRT
jgi:hypothetical protein